MDGRKQKAVRIALIAGALVLLVAIVVAVLLPARADYTERAQVAEAISLLSAARTPLAEHFQEHQRWPATFDGRTATSGKYTDSIRISRGANGTDAIELTATVRTQGVREAVAGRTIRMSSTDGGLNWKCGPGTIDAKWLPSTCRP